jgi:hypothetical protein
MIARSWALSFSFLLTVGYGQQPISEGILLIAQVKRVMAAHLGGVPNYTCLETVERYQRRGAAAKESLVDVVRLEVAFADGKELFAWPGSSRFEDRELREIVSTGAFGTGDFVLHARGVFLADGTAFEYLGEELLEGRPARKFGYTKPLFRSGYQISNQRAGRAEVAYRGEFWVEKESSDLMRLTVEALDIPVELEVAAANSRLDYSMVPLGGKRALLPKESELKMTDARGVISINRTRLNRCKLFQGESSVSFADVEEEGKPAAETLRPLVLAAGQEVALALDTEIVHGQSAVGDAIEATLRFDLRKGKEVILAKGARARGRIIELTRHENPECFTVGFQMEELEGSGQLAKLRLRLLRTEPQSGPPTPSGTRGAETYFEYPMPGRNGFVWFRPQLRLPRGFVTIWETQSIAQ